MAEPHTALVGPAAAIPASALASALLGVPLELFAWALFGGIVGVMNVEPKQPPLVGAQLVFYGAARLLVATGLGGVFSGLAVPVAIEYIHGLASVPPMLMQGAAAIVLGSATVLLPEVFRVAKAFLGKAGA